MNWLPRGRRHLPNPSSLGWEDALEEEMTTHSCVLAWRIARTEKPGGLQSVGHRESHVTEQLSTAQHR